MRIQMRWAIVTGVLTVACWAPALQARAQTQETPATADVIAQVNGESITAAEVDKTIGQQISRLEEQIYNLRRQRVDSLIADRLLAAEAAKRKITVSALIDAEVTSKVTIVTEAEVDTFIDANKGRLKGEGAELRETVRTQLQRQKALTQRQAYIDSLRAASSVVVRLPLPPVLRVDVSPSAAAAMRGSPNAPITIEEFTDFHCPYCKSSQSVVEAVLARYGDAVRLVQHDLPIDALHPLARKVHEAARCAGEQGKFWEYRQKAFAVVPKNAAERVQIATEIGLNVFTFNKCIANDAVATAVRRDEEQARTLNITSTPTFYINGRMILGAQPLEAFVRVIDDELARTAKKP